MEAKLELVRGATRPVLAILGLALWGLFIADGVPYPEEFKWLVVGMVGWYFGERLMQRLQGQI